MARKDITDLMVCQAYQNYFLHNERPLNYLMRNTKEPEKVCWRAMERASERGYINYGVGLNVGWLTQKGKELLNESSTRRKAN